MDSDQTPATRAARPQAGPKRGGSTLWAALGLGALVLAGVALFALGVFKPDPSKVARETNLKVVEAIQALPANADAAATLAALNQIVVPFAAGSNALPPEAETVLKVAAQKINALPAGTKIDVVALSPSTPKSEPEFRLILERATAVITYLEANGVAPGRLRAIGSSAPLPAGKQADSYTGPLIAFRPAS
jgi:outer membrane protein OmpA-like peptidoglycan-associated protein